MLKWFTVPSGAVEIEGEALLLATLYVSTEPAAGVGAPAEDGIAAGPERRGPVMGPPELLPMAELG